MGAHVPGAPSAVLLRLPPGGFPWASRQGGGDKDLALDICVPSAFPGQLCATSYVFTWNPSTAEPKQPSLWDTVGLKEMA